MNTKMTRYRIVTIAEDDSDDDLPVLELDPGHAHNDMLSETLQTVPELFKIDKFSAASISGPMPNWPIAVFKIEGIKADMTRTDLCMLVELQDLDPETDESFDPII